MLRPGVLDKVVAHYRGLLGDRLVGLALYGSHARGDAGEHSDLDVFVLAAGLPADRFERARALPTPDLDLYLDPPVCPRALTPEEWAIDISPLDLDIAIDARVLHDRDGTLAAGLAVVRRRIEEAGLYRTDDLFWHWRRPPSRPDWAIRWDGVVL